ncbi:MAG: IPT/TIG domain-containing protein [Zetaproteobacteria bacterium]|nr:IPT/TIG domain-containing protein [Zetaproteobacteria bacterium]
MFVNRTFVIWGRLFLVSLVVASCGGSPEETAPELDFQGLSTVTRAGQSSFILAWQHPENVQAVRYEVYLQKMTGGEFVSKTAGAVQSEGSTGDAALALNSGTGTSSAKGVFVVLAEDESPLVNGELLKSIEGDLNSYKIESLDTGNYAIAVLAEDDLGRRSFAGQVYLLAVQPVVQFEGLKRATLEKDGVLLEWDPLKTSIRGKDSFYTVFLGASFSKPIAIVKEHRYKFSIADVKEGTTLTFAVRATDPRGQQDVNTVTHSVTIPVDDVPFEGCVKARALGADRVEVHFEWPTHREFRSMVVMREGIEVYRTSNKTETSYLDLELSEGEAYTYRCDAVFGQFTKVGSREIEISTLTSNPPQFEGIEKLEIVSATEAKVYWGVATGVAANTYQVYANPGQQVDWEKGPVKTVKSDVLEATVGDLGDDLTIAFGVRACSAADICDFNEVTLFETTADVGPPQTKGALAVRIENSKALVSAPWEGAHGGIAQRILYVKEGTVSQDLSDYRKVQVINTQNNWEVPVELTYSNLLENITYHFIVRDIDPSGNENKSLKVASITTGDLTAPTFAGLTQVRNQVQGDAGDPETELILDFTAIKPQAIDPSGAHEYIIYTAPEDKDACAEADHTVLKRLPASSFAAGAAEYVVSGLTPRTVYHFCLKAVDEAGNISDTTSSFKRNTLDITAPSFDGLQTIKFDRESGKVQLSWNEVTDTDLDGFKLKLWIGNPDSTAVANVVLPVSKDHKASYEFGRDAFSFASLDQVYALLQACDDAHTLTNGTQNCTTLADDSALSVTLDDIEPPSGFLGVGAATSFTQPAQGSVGVTWIAPSDWTDYAGFKVYAVNSQDESLTFLKDCFCVSQNCLANPKTSCVVDGLSAYREYRFHVKAYDADGNHTTLSVADSSTSVRVNDATSPAFAVALQLTFEEGKSKLAWSAATDDQYVEDEDTTFITYTLYRKQSADFTSLTDPSSDGAHEVIYTGKALAHEDGLNLVSGVTYYYALCAQDMSSNSTCLSSSKSVKVPDLIPPTISAFTSDRVDNDDKTWKLQWTVSDNDTSTSQLVVQVKALYSTSAVASDFSSAASLFINNTGATDTGSAAADLLSGEANVDKYVHYMLIVTDASGNKSYAYLSHFVKNKITIESVVGAESSVAGGTRMILRGSGFHTSSTVKVAGQDCSNLKSYERILVCDTPAGSLGLEDIVVANEDGSSTTKTSAYRYCTPNVDCNNICNNPLSWDTGTDFALTVGRGDLPESPYIICTKDHLSKVRDYENMTNKYFEMHANIDLSDSAPGIGTFYGIFDGKGYAVENLELDQDSSAIGLFNRVAWAGSVKNIGVIEGEVAAKERGGLIVGQLDSSASHPSLSGFYGTGVVRSAGSLYSARSMGWLFG